MTRTIRAALVLDLRLLRRYGFYYAAAFSTVLWIGVLALVPAWLIGPAMPYVIFGDLAIVGFFFIAAAVFFEKGERTLFALLTTPLRFGDYLTAKVTALTALAVVISLVVALAGVGTGFSLPLLLAGVVLTSVLMLLVGFLTAVPYPSISEWLMPSTIPLLVLNLPLIDYSGLFPHALFYLVPTEGSLLLMGAAFGQLTLSGWQLAYALGYQALWIAVLFHAARRAFHRYVVAAQGAS